MSGTSMATPAVAGGVACLMAADFTKVCSTKNAIAAKRLADVMTSYKIPGRRLMDPIITQRIFYIPHDRSVACPDTSF
jgi:subtilisin family serine protease